MDSEAMVLASQMCKIISTVHACMLLSQHGKYRQCVLHINAIIMHYI